MSNSTQGHKTVERPVNTLVKESYECVRRVLELDSQTVVADLNAMEAINTDAAVRYREYEVQLAQLSESSKQIRHHNDEFTELCRQIDGIEKSVDKLDEMVGELDEWSSELEVKARRYAKNYK